MHNDEQWRWRMNLATKLDTSNKILTGNVGPILLAKNISSRLQLTGTNIHGSTRLPLLLLLADAEHDLQPLLNGLLRLLGHQLAILASHSKSLTTLRMSKNHPRHTHIFELRSGNFASVSSASGKAAVLSGNFDIVTEGHEGDGNVHGRASDDHLGVGGDGAGSVEFRDDLFKGGDGSVALPVAADEVLAFAFGGGSALGGARGAFAGRREGHGGISH